MALPNATYGDVTTTTMRGRRRKLRDNMSKNNAIVYQLSKKGKIDPCGGGTVIVEELDYAENQTFKRYSGIEPFNINQSQTFSAAEFAWKQAAIAVVISGREKMMNRGQEQMIGLLKARMKNMERTFLNKLAGDMYSNGTADGGKQMGGLQLLVSTSPNTGTVGGIDAAEHSFWRNQYDNTTLTDANVEDRMRRMFVKLTRNDDHPDMILAGDDAYLRFWKSMRADARFVPDKAMAKAGWMNLSFMNSKVVLDGGQGGNCPSNSMYMLNCDYMSYRPHRSRDMTTLPKRRPVDQDAEISVLAWMGNMTISNRALQGRIGNN